MTTSQVQKIETEFPIKADAKEFYDVFCNKTHQVAKAWPDIVKSVVIHEGEWGTERSIISWNYVYDGKACVAKEIIEDIDKEDNKMSFRVLEADLLNHYKSFKFLLHAVPKKEGGSMVHWTIEYEKINDNTSDPHTLLQLVVQESKQVEAHLISQDC
ncbi:MLP-like protein 43 [Arachis stenosperma]|uniref:MLP-like protein 43 n=1 Tax=Arachis stenosperma TaxID=217475 RepID=UPI0025ABABD5|nr:MLP-like protein 43 [Arachis stenosperma]